MLVDDDVRFIETIDDIDRPFDLLNVELAGCEDQITGSEFASGNLLDAVFVSEETMVL